MPSAPIRTLEQPDGGVLLTLTCAAGHSGKPFELSSLLTKKQRGKWAAAFRKLMEGAWDQHQREYHDRARPA